MCTGSHFCTQESSLFIHLFISQYYGLGVFIHSDALSPLVLLKSHTAGSGAAMTSTLSPNNQTEKLPMCAENHIKPHKKHI